MDIVDVTRIVEESKDDDITLTLELGSARMETNSGQTCVSAFQRFMKLST